MYPTSKIIEQVTIADLDVYLLCAESNNPKNDSNYEERLRTAHDHCKRVILRYDQNEDSELMLAMLHLIDEYEKVYIKLGLRSGLMFLTDITESLQEQSASRESDNDSYDKISNRIYLQVLPTLIRNGGPLIQINKSDFEEREKEAYAKLENELMKHINEGDFKAVENEIDRYTAIIEETQFSLGMKFGARFMQQLIGNLDSDF